MSIIRCPECSRDISDKARSCPCCGYPLDDEAQSIAAKQQAPSGLDKPVDAVKERQSSQHGDKPKPSILPDEKGDAGHENRKIAVIVLIAAAVLIVIVATSLAMCSQLARDATSSSDSKSKTAGIGETAYRGAGLSQGGGGANTGSVKLGYLVITDQNCIYDESTGYAKTTATIKNTSSSLVFSFVKVRETFYANGSSKATDTDWTYAVDSDGLRPGESKRFDLMSKQPSINFTFELEVIEAKAG